MHSIYIHIPFCLQKCSYCDFFSVTDQSLLNNYVDGLVQEIQFWASAYSRTEIRTLFFGGGTPSLLTPAQLEKILNALNKVFKLNPDLEFTLEVNPETFNQEKFSAYRALGVNRISVGIQSFQDQELKYLGRIHDSAKAASALNWISKLFENFSIDLMYGLPAQTVEQANQNILTALSFKPKHISYYELTPVLSSQTEFYFSGKTLLEKHGLMQYEISNYTKPGFACHHNLAYWSDESYLGLGAGAHSYDKNKKIRWANTTELPDYLNSKFILTKEPAKPSEAIFMGLRKTAGISKEYFVNFKGQVDKLLSLGLLAENTTNYKLTEKGQVISNQVFLEFI